MNAGATKSAVRLLAASGLFGLWGLIVVLQVPHSGELVQGIVTALTGLGVFHAVDSWRAESPTGKIGE